MNFFQAQDRARRNTLYLVVLFLLSVTATIVIAYLATYYALVWLNDEPMTQPPQLDEFLLLNVGGGVLALVLMSGLCKAVELTVGGGKKVAETFGGRLLMPSTRDAGERRLLNIVSEMAIAAGAPLPDVYLIPDFQINAFAAGTTPHNAVIGVTRGAVEKLSREELQGVVAHEFSHIMNGDMRINIRLIAVVHGITLLGTIGYFFLRGSLYAPRSRAGGRDDAGLTGLLAVAGLVLVVTGFIGTFFGSLIRAAVSRQREFLADAAAVQYTRNPMGIAGALDGIMRHHATASGHPNAAEFSHMFFSMAMSGGMASPFATHPPVRKRIARLLPDWPANQPIHKPVTSPQTEAAEKKAAAAKEKVGAVLAGVAGGGAMAAMAGQLAASPAPAPAAPVAAPPEAAVLEQVGTIPPLALECAHTLMENLPLNLRAATEDPYAARALIYALLLDQEQPGIRAAQMQHLEEHADTGVAALTNGLWPAMTNLPPAVRLPLAQAAMPALHLLSLQQVERFKQNIAALIAADEQMNVYEWSLQAVVVHHLQEYFGAHRRTYGDKNASMEYALSILAQCAQHGRAGNAFAAAVRHARLPLAFLESEFQPRRLFYALQHIAALKPRKKEQFAMAAAKCVAHDGRIETDEETLLRAYFLIIGCPLPLLTPAAAPPAEAGASG